MQEVEVLLQQSQTLLQSPTLAQADTRRDEAFRFCMKADGAYPNYSAGLDFAQKSLLLAREAVDYNRQYRDLRKEQ